MIWLYLNTVQNLAELDDLYKEIISEFADTAKKEYCLSLRYRIQEDLGRAESSKEKQELRRLLKAVEKELVRF